MKSITAKVIEIKARADAWVKRTKENALMTYKLGFSGDWARDLKELPSFLLGFALAVGIALVVLGNFATGLGATNAGNTVTNIVGYFNSGLVSFGALIVIIVFVVAIYAILKDKKLI